MSSSACPHTSEYAGGFVTRGGCHTASLRNGDITASVPRTVETADWNPVFLFWITNMSGSEDGITEQCDLWIPLCFHVQSFPIIVFRFFSCTPYFTIPTAQTASSKPRHKNPRSVQFLLSMKNNKIPLYPDIAQPYKKPRGAYFSFSSTRERLLVMCKLE